MSFLSLEIKYEIIPADIDEKAIRDEDLTLRAEKIARGKAEEVAKNNNGITIARAIIALITLCFIYHHLLKLYYK